MHSRKSSGATRHCAPLFPWIHWARCRSSILRSLLPFPWWTCGNCPRNIEKNLRSLLLTLGENEQILVLTMHHIVSDRWSVHVLVHELSVLYDTFCRAAASPLPELMAQYADFALWQRSRMSGDRLKEQL